MNHIGKKIGKRVLSFGLTAVMLTSVLSVAFSASVASAAETGTEGVSQIHESSGNMGGADFDGYVGVANDCEIIDFSELSEDEIITSVEDYLEFSGNDELDPGAAAQSLPAECDNSTNENSIYCPPIGDQGMVSACGTWSASYYNYTYMANRARGIRTTENNIFSPIWTYNLGNYGYVEGGLNSPVVYNIIRIMGALTVEDVPATNSIDPRQLIFDWHAENGLWKKALRNRLTNYGFFTPESYVEGYYPGFNTPVAATGSPVTSADDPDLAAMKTAISSGEVLNFNSFVFGWDETKIKRASGVDNRFVGETIIRGCKERNGYHAMVIVGYNDNIWTDINDNNKIDSGEMGAFKIANSWSTIYGNKGFCWIAYDAMNKVSSVSGAPSYTNRQPCIDTVSAIKVDPIKYESGVYLKYVLNSAERANTHVYVTAIKKSDRSKTITKLVPPYNLEAAVNPIDIVEDFSYRGTSTAADGEMYYDLNNLIPDIDISKINDYDWQVNIYDTTDNSKPLTIKEVKIIDDSTNGEFDMLNGGPYTINGSGKVFYTNEVNFPFSAEVEVSPSDIHTLEEFKISAITKGGKAPFKYQYELEKDGKKTMLESFCNNYQSFQRLDVNGDCTIVVTVKDAEGKTAVARKPITIKKTEITALTPDKATAGTGDTIVFTPQVSNLAPSINFVDFYYTVTKDGVSEQYTAEMDKSLEWTPKEGGNYTITCEIKTRNGLIASKTVDYTVKDNNITIYYKGYSNPNIHYQIGGGSWTDVPGVAMTATNEMSGYTHKYTIDLGTASYANVCFNDGNGNWDSNNGSNYRFEKGNYKYSNGTITKFEPTPPSLEASLSMSKSEVIKDEKITLNASAVNGKAPYQYKLTYTHNSTTHTVSDYSNNSSFTFTPDTNGSYVFKLTVKDAKGKTATASKTLTVKTPSITSVNTSAASAGIGENITISMTVANDISGIQRSYQIEKDGNITNLSAGSNGTVSWAPSELGTYTITGVLTYNGKTYLSSPVTFEAVEAPSNKVTIYYKGYSNPNIHYQIGNGSWTAVPGIAMTATNELSGYTHKYTIDLGNASYANVCFNNGSSWDSNNGSNYRFEKGSYKFSNGTITKIDSTPAALTANLSLSKSEALKNETVTLNASASNGKAPYQYKLTYKLNGVSYTAADYGTTSSFNFTPIMNGSYVFTLTAKDANGKTATASKSFTAKTPSITSVNTSTASAKVGETVKLSMTVADNMSSMTRSYKVTNGSVTNTLTANSAGEASWTPSQAGTYTITGILTYNGSTYTSSSITYTVSEAPANNVTIYYKGYSNPNIHYQVGSGSWTAVPGIAMTATNELSGYTHKYTIDLGNASYANVCFNNRNSWDSNNGSNYRFEKGYYKFSNGTITKFEPTPAGLSASLSLSKSEALKNETVTLNASAANGKAPYQYKLTYKLNGVSYTVADYGTTSSFNFTPIMNGSYVFTLTAKDADGKTATASKSFAAKTPSITSVNTSTASAKVGETVKLSMTVADNMSSMTRSYKVTKGSTTNTLSADSSGEASWTPSQAGTYTITGILTYNGKTYNSSSITYTVSEAPSNTVTIYYKGYSNPNIHYQVGSGSWTNVPGVAMTATNEMSGYTHKYTINLGNASYANVCFNDGNGNWDSRNGANYRFEKGTYKFSNGNITRV